MRLYIIEEENVVDLGGRRFELEPDEVVPPPPPDAKSGKDLRSQQSLDFFPAISFQPGLQTKHKLRSDALWDFAVFPETGCTVSWGPFSWRDQLIDAHGNTLLTDCSPSSRVSKYSTVMDLDIDDILADVSHPHQLHPSQFSQSQIDPSTSFSDHQKLVRAWTTERCTTHLQPYPTDLLRTTMARVQAQIMKVEDLSNSDPNSTDGTSNQNLNLTLSILQTDLSRTQFLIRSLLRCRLAKITKYAAFYLEQLNTSETKDGLLGESEVHFLRSHQALLSNFYSGSFLDAFPSHLRRLDDKAGGNSMVEGPDVQEAVFVRCLGEHWESDPGADGEGVELRMRRGEVWVVRWEDVQGGVKAGVLELL